MEDKKKSRFSTLIDVLFNNANDMKADIKQQLKADFETGLSANYNQIFTWSYNGEKNMGEIGPIKDYRLDYEALRLRSWDAYLTSEIAQTVIKKYILWMIGTGLKLQCSPNKTVLKTEGIEFESEQFNKITEARYSVFSKSKMSDNSGMRSLNYISKTAYKNAIIGGDVLVVLRYSKKKGVTVQMIDGSHVQSPVYGSEWFPQTLANGNIIKNGIEVTPSGEHVNYFVRNRDYTYTVISAKGKNSGLVQAFMVYGLEYRLDNIRGVPLISVVLEKIAKLERYSEAAVGSAEERQKIAYSIEHQQFSTGENPLAKQLVKSYDADAVTDELPKDTLGNELANTIAATTNKQTYNMPIGASLKALESKNELYFKEFFTTYIDLICATIGIPPNVAMSSYNDSFSASRAATKDWEHTLNVGRADFSSQFDQNIYNYWLEIQILTNKIQAPGYLQALLENNTMVLEAYRTARFTGAMFPHIDPLKEANAERVKLGALAANIPLTTVEAATEALNCGEADSNMEQFYEELEMATEMGLHVVPETNENKDVKKSGDKKKEEED